MKKYDQDTGCEILVCNGCGQVIAPADDCDKAAFLAVRQEWGYFSRWDGCCHTFHLCENCYEEMIGTWAFPPDIEEKTELL